MTQPLSDLALDQLFLEARSIQTFTAAAVPDDLLRQLYDLARQAPTGFNCQPARYVFVRSAAAKQQLAPLLSTSNRTKILDAPVTVLVGYDRDFVDRVRELFPRFDARPLFRADPALAEETACRNSLLQAGFLIVAARALGLDAGPMSGFNADAIAGLFFAGRPVRVVLAINLGYGDRHSLAPRLPRLEWQDAAVFA